MGERIDGWASEGQEVAGAGNRSRCCGQAASSAAAMHTHTHMLTGGAKVNALCGAGGSVDDLSNVDLWAWRVCGRKIAGMAWLCGLSGAAASGLVTKAVGRTNCILH